jgi:heme exporter protein D
VWVVLAIVAALLCLGPATPLGTLFFYAPGYSAFRASARHLFVVTLCLSVASGIGLAHFIRDPRHGWTVAASLLATSTVALLGIAGFAAARSSAWASLSGHAGYVPWAVGMPLVTGGVLMVSSVAVARLTSKRTISSGMVGLCLLMVHLGDMLAVHDMLPGRRFQYAQGRPDLWTLRPEIAELRNELRRSGGRVLAADGYDNPLLTPNLTRAWNIPAAGGTGPLAVQRYADTLGMGGPGDVDPETLSDVHRGPDLFAVQYVVLSADLPVVEDMRRQVGRWQERKALEKDNLLFWNARAHPRAWCVSEIVRADDTWDVVRLGRLPDGRVFDPSLVAITDPGVLPDWPASSPAGTPSRVVATRVPGSEGEYEVDTGNRDCLLVLSEVHYPWWRVSIDGERVPVFRVNHAMIGVAVPRGQHIVRLWLAPWSVWIGGAISVIALVALTVVALRPRHHPIETTSSTYQVP